MSDAGEFLRNAIACLRSASDSSLSRSVRMALLDYAQMWVDAAVIASGLPPCRPRLQ
jgi:hypothetical protein